MHKELLQFLACPICSTSLIFSGTISDNRLVNGHLKCEKGHLYQIKEEMGLIKDAKLSAREFKWTVDVANENKYDEIRKQYNSYLSEDLRIASKKLIEMLSDNVIKSCRDTDNVILDIASGMGGLILQLAEKIPKDVVIIGTDVDEKPLRGAMNKARRAGIYQKLSFIVTDAKHLAFKDNALSTISSHFGFDNVPETVSAFKEGFRVLKPGGNVIFSSLWLREDSESIKIAEKYRVGQIASENRLEQTLKRTGFILDWFEELYSGVWPYNPMDLLPVQGEDFSYVIVQIRKPKNA